MLHPPEHLIRGLPLTFLPLEKVNNVANFRHIFVGGDVLDAPRKNDVTLFPYGQSRTPVPTNFRSISSCRGDLGTPKTRFAHFREPSPRNPKNSLRSFSGTLACVRQRKNDRAIARSFLLIFSFSFPYFVFLNLSCFRLRMIYMNRFSFA